jgi:hypothetical protein
VYTTMTPRSLKAPYVRRHGSPYWNIKE